MHPRRIKLDLSVVDVNKKNFLHLPSLSIEIRIQVLGHLFPNCSRSLRNLLSFFAQAGTFSFAVDALFLDTLLLVSCF